jgi:hypothetical protein
MEMEAVLLASMISLFEGHRNKRTQVPAHNGGGVVLV